VNPTGNSEAGAASQSDAVPRIGAGTVRSDGVAKVTGIALYSAEFQMPGMVHAALATSTIPNGRIADIDTTAAQRMPGVLLVLTHRNAPQLPEGGKAGIKPPAGRVLSVLQDDRIHYSGQPIAVVVANTLEQAQSAAHALVVRYAAEPPALDFAAQRSRAYKPESLTGGEADTRRGDPDAASTHAPFRIDATYTTPIEHHNPMEPHATIAAWEGDRLTLYDSTQYVDGVRTTMAKLLGIEPDNIRVVCHYTGGGFGCKGSMWSHVALAAMAARQVQRPVKLALERTQMFPTVGFRPRTEQHVQLAADDNGRLLAVQHDVLTHTSTLEDWTEPCAVVTRMLYACPNLATSHRLLALNTGTPTFMRAPGEASGTFALESAMDELAYALKMDPIELRLRNYAQADPQKELPFSSKSLRQCYALGAQRFGWARRNPLPRSQRDGLRLVGWGMATATYPTFRLPAQAQVELRTDGSVRVATGSQDLGTGTYTILQQIAADVLQLPARKIVVEIGDTRLPQAPVSGGSMTAASVGSAVQAAALDLRRKIIERALADAASPLHGAQADAVTLQNGQLVAGERSDTLDAIAGRSKTVLVGSAKVAPGAEAKQYSMHAFGAVFAEVKVDEELARLEVSRIHGAYAVGTLLNARTGHSQLLGGIVGGIGMALFEESLLDTQEGRFINANLADYHVPVNADIGAIDIAFVPEEDRIVNPLGAKGIGEIGITGVAAAIGNAVFHATGKRIRELPLTPDKLV
jgi:xanthine dehydrogenase YagR molybdenum-binding subunit